MKKRNFIYMCFILPSFIGIMAFYIVPFLLSLYFAVIDNMMNKEWVGLKNFKLLFENELFLSALRNTGIFCGIAIPAGNGDCFASGTGFEKAEERSNSSYPAPDPINRSIWNGDCFLEIFV